MHELHPSSELFGRIISQITYEQQLLLLKRRLILFMSGLLGSLVLFILAFRDFFAQAGQSGFIELLKLTGTDFTTVSSHFSEYFLSLVESLPIISIAVVSALLLVTLISLFKFLNYAMKIKHLRVN